MPSETQDTLYEQFVAVAGEVVGVAGSVAGIVSDLANQTAAGASSAPSATTSDESTLDTVGDIAKSIGENVLGAVPLARAIFSLFGGGDDSPAPPALTKFLLPSSVQFTAAATSAGIENVDYTQAGAPRPFGATSAPSQSAPAQVTVNVQAMDARSFLDRSGDIAAAVRDAMLNSSSINDVVTEL